MILRDKDKNKIIEIAKNTLQTPVEILAYGSRVNGEAHECSDLDLALVSLEQKPLPINELVDFKEALSDSSIPILVQVLDWYRIPEYFRTNIEQQNELLFKENEK